MSMSEEQEKNARRAAVALEYTPERDPAPRMTALGRGLTAERIIAAARAAGIPLHQDKTLVELLIQFDLDACIPPALYEAVAEILVFLYKLDREWKEHTDDPS